jgi:hypothetical protein
MTVFVNLKIKPTQSFGGAHNDRIYIYVFIKINTQRHINICVCTVFQKSDRVNKQLINWLNNSVADQLYRFGAVLRTVKELTNNCRRPSWNGKGSRSDIIWNKRLVHLEKWEATEKKLRVRTIIPGSL